MRACFLLFCGMFLIAGPSLASAQIILGHVIDETSKLGIRAVDLQLIDRAGTTRARMLSDSAGNFRLQAPIPGPYRVTAVIIGYANVTTSELLLSEGLEIDLELKLAVSGIPLEPIRVIGQRTIPLGRLADYYQRSAWTRKTGMGRVFMRDDLERMDPFSVTSVLRMQPRRIDCPMVYMLDGLPLQEDMIDQLVRPDEVEGIEVYRGIQVPPEYQRRTPCGITLIWSRREMPGQRPMTWRRIFLTLGFVGMIWGAQAWVR